MVIRFSEKSVWSFGNWLGNSYSLRAEIFAIINCCGTYFCDFAPKSQKFDPQDAVWMSQSQK